MVQLFSDYGSSNNSHVQYAGNGENTRAGTYNVNIAVSPLSGTIDGQNATVNGNMLTLNNSASKANGLQISYTGTTPTPAGTTFTLTRGIASLLESVTNSLMDPANGTVTVTENACQTSIDAYGKKLSDMQASIAQKMAAMQTQFQNMDSAVAKMKSLQSYLTSQGL